MSLTEAQIVLMHKASAEHRKWNLLRQQPGSKIRLGQHLLSVLAPTHTDSEIFYEEDPGRAFDLFLERVVGIKKGETP